MHAQTAEATKRRVAKESASANPAESAKAVQGPQTDKPSFAAWLAAAPSYKVGKQGMVTAVLVPKAPYHCNKMYPYKFKLNPPSAGVSYPQTTVRGAQVSQQRAMLAIPFTASSAGDATISGTLYFSICTPSNCKMEKVPLSVKVHVKP